MDKQSFISKVKDGAIKGMQQYGVLASVTIAQAILESGWGTNTPGNNLFGIKWSRGYDSQILATKEYENGKCISINAAFRRYSSWNDSLSDHALFLKQNSRYANLLGKTDYKTVCNLIKQDGYATDPNYATLLIQLIEQNNLNQYDAVIANGWHLSNNIWSFYKNKVKVVNTWEQDSKKLWYFLDGAGNMCANRWIASNNIWYYLSADGSMAVSKWIQEPTSKLWYYVNEKGEMLKNKSTPDGYIVDKNGVWNGMAKIKI